MKAIFVKSAYRYGVDAETLLALRMLYALPFFGLMAVWVHRKAPLKMTRKDLLQLTLLGFLGYYLASYLDFLGLQYISAALERLILFLYPTIVVVISALLLGKPISRNTFWALLLSYAGLLVALVGEVHLGGLTNLLLGGVLVFASGVSYATYLLNSGSVLARLGSMRVAAYATAIACLFTIVQFVVMRPISNLVQPWPVHALGVCMAIFSTVLPVWLLSEAIRRMGAGPTAMIGSLGPVITILLAATVLGEPLGWPQLVGATLVMMGVAQVSRLK